MRWSKTKEQRGDTLVWWVSGISCYLIGHTLLVKWLKSMVWMGFSLSFYFMSRWGF